MNLDQLRIPTMGPLGGVNQLHGLYDLIQEHFDETTYICELGSHAGVSASLFAETCGKVITIDNVCRPGMSDVEARYDNLEFILSLTEKVVRVFNDGEFDAVYVDASHKFRHVRRDLQLWIPKIKPGGVICGHDYVTPEIAAIDIPGFDWFGKAMGRGGVNKAVDQRFPKIQTYKDSSWAVKL